MVTLISIVVVYVSKAIPVLVNEIFEAKVTSAWAKGETCASEEEGIFVLVKERTFVSVIRETSVLVNGEVFDLVKERIFVQVKGEIFVLNE